MMTDLLPIDGHHHFVLSAFDITIQILKICRFNTDRPDRKTLRDDAQLLSDYLGFFQRIECSDYNRTVNDRPTSYQRMLEKFLQNVNIEETVLKLTDLES